MKVQSLSLQVPRSLSDARTNRAEVASTAQQDQAEIGKSAGFKSYLGGAGGAVLGVGAGAASGAAAVLISQQLERVLEATLPALDAVAPGTSAILATGAKIALYGSAAAAAAGGVVGAQVAFAAANGATKPDITEPLTNKGVAHRRSAAEFREHVSKVGSAESFGQASAAGFRAGASIGGPAGALAGKIQGALLGAAVGGAAALPLLSLVSHPAILIPGALAGAALGAKIGEPIGHAAGALGMGALGAAGGAAYHGAHKLF